MIPGGIADEAAAVIPVRFAGGDGAEPPLTRERSWAGMAVVVLRTGPVGVPPLRRLCGRPSGGADNGRCCPGS